MTPKRWLAVILMLAALAPPVIQRTNRARHLKRCKSNVRSVATALEMYASAFGGRYPKDLGTLVATGHLKTLPTCPAAGFDNYSATYHRTDQPDRFSFGCQGRYHGAPSQARTHQAWADRMRSSRQGFPWCDSEVCLVCMGSDF